MCCSILENIPGCNSFWAPLTSIVEKKNYVLHILQNILLCVLLEGESMMIFGCTVSLRSLMFTQKSS